MEVISAIREPISALCVMERVEWCLGCAESAPDRQAVPLASLPRRRTEESEESVPDDWAAVARTMDTRLAELGMRQRDLAARAHVSQAIVRELQHNTAQRRRSARTLEALSVALGWHPRHLHAVLSGQRPPDPDAAVLLGPDAIAGRLAAIEGQLRSIEQRLIDVQRRIGQADPRMNGG
jgi:hypothetical protein